MKGKYGYLMGAAVAAAMTFGAAQADAALIEGGMSFTGSVTPRVSSGGAATTVDQANFLDFFSNPAGPTGKITAGDGTQFGDFTSVADGTVGVIKDISIDPFTGPIVDFWVIGDFHFELLTLVIEQQDADGIDLQGTGTITAVGFDPTPGTWLFSTQNGRTTVTFSASTQIDAVPAPAAIGLLGLGLIGLGAAARRRNA